jgi:hypothetical protein
MLNSIHIGQELWEVRVRIHLRATSGVTITSPIFTKLAPARQRFVKTHRISRKADKRFRSQMDGRGLHVRRSLQSADCILLLTLQTGGHKQDFSFALLVTELLARWALHVYGVGQFVVSNGNKTCDYIDGSFKTGQGLTSLSHGPAYR